MSAHGKTTSKTLLQFGKHLTYINQHGKGFTQAGKSVILHIRNLGLSAKTAEGSVNLLSAGFRGLGKGIAVVRTALAALLSPLGLVIAPFVILERTLSYLHKQ